MSELPNLDLSPTVNGKAEARLSEVAAIQDKNSSSLAVEQRSSLDDELIKKKEELRAIEGEIERKKGLRDNIYSKINVSLKTMDRVVLVVSVLLAAALIYGVFGGR